MNRKSAGISALIVWMGGCMLACSVICLWAIRRSEAAFLYQGVSADVGSA